MFFYLDKDVRPGNNYTYSITSFDRTERIVKSIKSDNSITISIKPHVEQTESISHGKLISGPSLTPIKRTSFLFNLFQFVNAETSPPSIFTTSLNPQNESYRLALEPIHVDRIKGNCNQVLEFGYSKNIAKGQDFEIVASIFEVQTQTDDITGEEISVDVHVLKHQKVFTDFSDSNKLKQKWFTIQPHEQSIYNFTGMEIQFDITGK